MEVTCDDLERIIDLLIEHQSPHARAAIAALRARIDACTHDPCTCRIAGPVRIE